MSKIDLGDLDIFETRIIMLHRLKETRKGMAELCGVVPHHFIEWIKGNRDSARLQAKLEEHYLRICERKS